jgi:hypothetical protein
MKAILLLLAVLLSSASFAESWFSPYEMEAINKGMRDNAEKEAQEAAAFKMKRDTDSSKREVDEKDMVHAVAKENAGPDEKKMGIDQIKEPHPPAVKSRDKAAARKQIAAERIKQLEEEQNRLRQELDGATRGANRRDAAAR